MPALNFQARFADLVATGTKPHTIRAPRKVAVKVGDALHLYTGMRTKACRRLRPVTPCVAVACVGIHAPHAIVAIGPGSSRYREGVLTPEEVEALAKADGFANAKEFLAWFAETHGPEFRGHLIEWDTGNAEVRRGT